MTAFFNKFGKTLALAAAAATVLAMAFFLTDDNIKKNTSQENESLARSVPVTESRASLTYENSTVNGSATADLSGLPQSSLPADTSMSFPAPQLSVITPESAASLPAKTAEGSAPSDSPVNPAPSEQTEGSHSPAGDSSTDTSAEFEPSPLTESAVPTVESRDDSVISCAFAIECRVLIDKKDSLSRNKRSLVPDDGVILAELSADAVKGESVFDLTKRVCRENGIQFEFTLTPLYNSAYIEGIANLYEFDCGSASGWVYTVNGKMPSVGCSDVKLSDGDTIVWHYTLSLGNDILS